MRASSELAEGLQARGLECSLLTDGEPIALTPGIDLVGYRTIEATLDGAAACGCTRVQTTVRYGARRLELEVRGKGALPALDRALVAASERVELYGGRLERLDEADSAFTVRCRLPLEGQAG